MRPERFGSRGPSENVGAIHSTKLSGNFGPKLNGSVRSNRKSFEKTGPPFEVVLFSRSDRSEFWLNGSRPVCFPLVRLGYVTRSELTERDWENAVQGLVQGLGKGCLIIAGGGI